MATAADSNQAVLPYPSGLRTVMFNGVPGLGVYDPLPSSPTGGKYVAVPIAPVQLPDASTAAKGALRLASQSDVAALSAVVAMSPATFLAVLAALAPSLPTTPGSATGAPARVFLNDNLFAFG